MILLFPVQGRASLKGRIPKSDGSASLPERCKNSAKIECKSEGMRPRERQLETAGGPTEANLAASDVPPTASITASMVVSMAPEYSQSVNMSSVHIPAIENSCEPGTIHRMDSPKKLRKRLLETQKALGIKTKAEFCRKTGIRPNAWTQFTTENDDELRPITLECAIKICDRFNLTLDWIYRGRLLNLPGEFQDNLQQAA